jgi:outer membrane receptor protein involved in Fe transport
MEAYVSKMNTKTLVPRPLAAMILIFAMVFPFAGPAKAQLDTAVINGTVRDQSGAVIPNAAINVRNLNTGLVRTTTTNASGTYDMGEIPPGVYTIEAHAQGFSTSTQENVTLSLSQVLVFNFALKVGGTTDVVQVAASDVNLDTASSNLEITLPAQTVSELPLNGNNYSQELLLMPGVNSVNHDQTGGRTYSVGTAVFPSILGTTNRSNTYYLDGVNNNEAISGAEIITPITADIQQMTMVTHADSSQFGGAVGGIVNVITKSGSNNFHGGAWEYYQDSKLFNASNPITQTLTHYHQSQFGADIGGPVLLPHFNGRNKTFFYASYEGYRNATAAIQQALVPTTAQLGGDFSADLAKGIIIYNPYTGQPFPSNQITPTSLIDQNMVNFLKTVYPQPTGSYNNGVYNYESFLPSTHDSDQYDLRGDEYLTKKDQVWAHFLRQSDPTTSLSAVPHLASVTLYVGDNFGAQWIHSFSASSLLTVGFGFSIGNDEPTTTYNGPVDSIIGAAGFAQGFDCGFTYRVRPSDSCMLPSLSATNYISGGEGQGAPNYVSLTYEYTANYQQQFGRHHIFVGFNVDTNNQGKATSTGASAGFTQNPTSNGATGGDALASLLLSMPSTAGHSNIQNSEHGGYVDGAYIQDQWKLRDNLTLNYGLRYDLSFPPIITNSAIGPYYAQLDFYNGTLELQNNAPACSPTQFAPCIPGGTLPANVVISPHPGKLFFADKNDWSPRVGVSWLVRPNTVFHAGYGRSYDNWAGVEQTAQNVNGWLALSSISLANLNQPGTVKTPGTQVTAENPTAGFAGNTPPATPWAGAAGSYNSPPQFTAPHLDQWNVGVQQKAGALGVWTVNYVGSRGRNVDLDMEANTAPPGPGAVAPRTQFPYMLQAHWDIPVNKMDYEALETNFQGRSAKTGFTYVVSYTWSHTIDIGGDDLYGVGGAVYSVEHPFDLQLDRSNSGYDLPNVFTAAWTWAVPVGHGASLSTGNSKLDYVLGNWKLNGIVSFDSGSPFTIQASGDIGNTGNNTTYERANLVGNPSIAQRSRAKWFNTAAFATPAQYTLGALGRNTMRADGNKQFDSALFREFPFFHEKENLMVRLDVFNTFNHPIWGAPGSTVNNTTTFGTITSQANSPRVLQLSGKFTF